MVGGSRFGVVDPLVLALTFATSGASALFFGAVPVERIEREVLAALGAALRVGHSDPSQFDAAPPMRDMRKSVERRSGSSLRALWCAERILHNLFLRVAPSPREAW